MSSDTALFATSFFLTMTSIIGIGILSLPVRMYQCGIEPFIALFVVCGGVQVLLVVAMVELLQRVSRSLGPLAPLATIPIEPDDDEPNKLDWCEEPRPSPDLHTMAVLLLPTWAYIIFDFCAIFHFLSICMAYAISAGQLHKALLDAPFGIVVPFFVAVLSGIVFVFGSRLTRAVAWMTLVKGSVLVIMILMTLSLVL